MHILQAGYVYVARKFSRLTQGSRVGFVGTVTPNLFSGKHKKHSPTLRVSESQEHIRFNSSIDCHCRAERIRKHAAVT